MSPYWGISVFVDIYIYIYMFMALVLQNGGVRDPMLVSSSYVYMYTIGVYTYRHTQPFVWHVVGVGLEPSPIQI